MSIERLSLPEQHYLYVERRAAMGPEIGEAMGSGFGAMFEFTESRGIERLAMPVAVYTEMPSAPEMVFRTGFFVSEADAARAEGEVKADTVPAGDAFRTVHVGPYSMLNESHSALWSHIESLGVERAMPVWEVYIDDPGHVPEDRLRTEIYRAVG